jgi:hypothetical protein
MTAAWMSRAAPGAGDDRQAAPAVRRRAPRRRQVERTFGETSQERLPMRKGHAQITNPQAF